MIIDISMKYKLNSYKELINLVSPGLLGKIIDILTSFFMISGAAIILAGSGALFHENFGVTKWVGILLMVLISLIILFRNTKGLIEINSFIVPSLIIVLSTLFILYLMFSSKSLSLTYLKSIPNEKDHWLISTILYSCFNLLCCSGVLAPLSNELNNKKPLIYGIIIGSLTLTLLSFMINLMLMLNLPYIFKYEIPLLYIANRFGRLFQMLLLCIIWLEMFSTEVSDIYSLCKTLEQGYNIPYKNSLLVLMFIAVLISQVGFKNLITILYPAFGFISTIFMVYCFIFYKNNMLK